MLEIGTLAPLFSLNDQTGETFNLRHFKSTYTLLYFYPKDDTSGCTKEACAIRDIWAELKAEGVDVLGISADSVGSHKKFADKYTLPFTILADPEKEIISKYGAKGLGTKRISYLIDQNGIIAKTYTSVTPATHAANVLEDVKKLKT